jgi:DNA-binding XRE family transcriptional regulator
VCLDLRAASLAPHEPGTNGSSALPIDGARLGARLRELRVEAGLTQAELARRTGIHRPNIARVEAGRHTPSLETLARLASAIGVPTTRVLTGE